MIDASKCFDVSARACSGRRRFSARRTLGQSGRKQIAEPFERVAIERDVAMLSLVPHDEQARVEQQLQMMGDRGLRELEAVDDLAAAELIGLRELLHDAKARRVGEGFERLHELPIVHPSS